MNPHDKDSFFTDFEDRHKEMRKGMGRTFVGLGVVALILNLALLAGAIAVVVLVLRAFGVIG